MSKNKSPQSIRLQEFIDKTGYSVARFARECNITSARTLTKILSEGTTPSQKVVDKIIAAFPMLNHDWLVLGYGEPIVKGLQTLPVSVNSLEKSTESTYQLIAQALRDHDFALNELKLKVQEANIKVDSTAKFIVDRSEQNRIDEIERHDVLLKKLDNKMIALQNMGIEQLNKMQKAEDARIEKLDAERKEFMTIQFEAQILAVKTVLENNMKASKEMVTNFDIARQKRNLENAEKQTKEILTCLANGKESQTEQINNGIELGLKTFKDLVKKTTSETMTEFLNFLQGNESAKKTVSELGKHTKVSNPKPSR